MVLMIGNKMKSLDFLANYINPAREIEGESKLRNSELLRKIEDECDDLGGLHTFCNPNGTDMKFYFLDYDQLMLVGMRESKAVRKHVLAKLKELKEPQAPALPNTYLEALEQLVEKEKKLIEQAPKVAFVDSLVDRTNLLTATQIGQKHKLSAIKLNRILSELDVYNSNVKRSKVFKQWFIDKGYGEMKKTELGYDQPLFTNAGEIWINEKLVSEGIV